MNKDIEITVLKQNVADLQKQVHDAHVRILELQQQLQESKKAQDIVDKQMARALGL